MIAEKKAIEWLLSGDTGSSSKTILCAMLGHTCKDPDIPYDAGDFGRCYRLLLKFPQWGKRLDEVAKKHRQWKPFVEKWPDLEVLYERFCDPKGHYVYVADPWQQAFRDLIRTLRP